MASVSQFLAILQRQITAEDQKWEYTVPGLPRPDEANSAGLVKSIAFISSWKAEEVRLQFRRIDPNRATRNETPSMLLLVSFENFRLRQPGAADNGVVAFASARDTGDYIARVLKTGIVLNNTRFHFFGHSPSQQKSRSCYMYAGSKDHIAQKVEAMGDFSKLKSVGKKVKRIGLLFSSAEVVVTLNPSRCEDIPDVVRNDYIFTDGCGFIATDLAKDIARRKNIVHQNMRYLPSVFQIRYRGYKGVLMLNPNLKGEIQAQFRASMKKFGDVKDHSFAVVGYSKKLKAVELPELKHLTDCIVFPTTGDRPSADQMSGGDLDGDKFFVTWDKDLVPRSIAAAAAYTGVKEGISFGKITGDDRAEFFAGINNTSLGLVKKLYLKWAALKGPLSAECQQLNRLFSQCVDGNRIRVPEGLKDPPEPGDDAPRFILDVLHEAATAQIRHHIDDTCRVHQDWFGIEDILLDRNEIAMPEFKLIQLALRACEQNGSDFANYLAYFNYSTLNDEQRTWLLSRLPATKGLPSLILNGLLQSELLGPQELKRFGLNHANLRWKPVFSSGTGSMRRFLNVTSQALERFHKKLIIFRPSERLTLMIYVPQKIEQSSEVHVGGTVRVFALPQSSGSNSANYRVTPTKSEYRLYCDDRTFQLYDRKRANTFVYLFQGPLNTSSFQNLKTESAKRQEMQRTFEQGINAECRVSVALDKISAPIQKHVGKMNREPILAAEVYVISNRDVEAMRWLDMWLQYVGTEEVLPLFEIEDREYRVTTVHDIDRSEVSSTVAAVVLDQNLSALVNAESANEIYEILELQNRLGEKSRLYTTCEEILKRSADQSWAVKDQDLLQILLAFLPKAPFCTELVLKSQIWSENKRYIIENASFDFPTLLRELILSTNQLRSFVKAPISSVLRELETLSIRQLADLVELIALCVEHPDFALDIFLECLEPECGRLLSNTASDIKQLTKSLFGIALEHIDEADSQKRIEQQALSLRLDGQSNDFQAITAKLRIDSPGPPLKIGDHVRFVASSAPVNRPLEPAYVMDAIVIQSEPGSARFRCLHNPPPYLTDCTWKYKNCGPFVNSEAMINAVVAFYTEKSSVCAAYESITGKRDVTSNMNVIENAPFDPTLNASQNEALNAAIQYPFALLWGPPGTGKTHTVIVILKHLLRQFPNDRFLVVAPTHNAVDNILQRFINEGGPNSTGCTPLRVSTQLSKVSSGLRSYTCDAMVGKDLTADFAGRREAIKRVRESRLIFTTCAGAALGLLRKELFEIVLVDEASQQTEPGTLIPLVKGCRRAILVGDHVQLRATVQRHATVFDFDVSLFERVYTRAKQADNGDDGVARVMLDTQYRMHPDICGFSSKEFYQERLLTAPENMRIALPPSKFPWPASNRKVVVQCYSTEDLGNRSKMNKGQVHLTRRICELLTATPDNKIPPTSIAVLTPYTRQRESLTEALKDIVSDSMVSSIDGFQGREADIVVFVTVRCNPHYDIGFLKDLRRLNVAMTRARAGVILVGDRATLIGTASGDADVESKATWRRLLDGCVEVEVPAGP